MTTYRSHAPDTLRGSQDPGWTRGTTLEQLVAWVAVFLITLQKFSIGPDLMPRHVVAAALLPVWLVSVRRWRGATSWLVLGTAAGASGLVLAAVSGVTHDFSTSSMLQVMVLLVGLVTGVCVVLWSRQVLSDWQVALAFAAGVVINSAARLNTLSGIGLLKFGVLLPITIVLLAAVYRQARGVQLAAVLALAVLASFSDVRSTFGMFLVAAALLAWQMRPSTISRTKSWVSTAALFAVLGVVVYRLGTALVLAGLLGPEAQQRSVNQLSAAGSLIIGGRPEMAAAAALFFVHPYGFGAGISVNHADLQVAKAGMTAINYSPENGYVERYMFGSNIIELHSVFGDLWAAFGLVGLALTLFILWQVIRNLSVLVVNRRASALILYLCCFSLWNLFFSPIYTSAPTLIVTLGLILPARQARQASQRDDPLGSNPVVLPRMRG